MSKRDDPRRIVEEVLIYHRPKTEKEFIGLVQKNYENSIERRDIRWISQFQRACMELVLKEAAVHEHFPNPYGTNYTLPRRKPKQALGPREECGDIRLRENPHLQVVRDNLAEPKQCQAIATISRAESVCTPVRSPLQEPECQGAAENRNQPEMSTSEEQGRTTILCSPPGLEFPRQTENPTYPPGMMPIGFPYGMPYPAPPWFYGANGTPSGSWPTGPWNTMMAHMFPSTTVSAPVVPSAPVASSWPVVSSAPARNLLSVVSSAPAAVSTAGEPSAPVVANQSERPRVYGRERSRLAETCYSDSEDEVGVSESRTFYSSRHFQSPTESPQRRTETPHPQVKFIDASIFRQRPCQERSGERPFEPLSRRQRSRARQRAHREEGRRVTIETQVFSRSETRDRELSSRGDDSRDHCVDLRVQLNQKRTREDQSRRDVGTSRRSAHKEPPSKRSRDSSRERCPVAGCRKEVGNLRHHLNEVHIPGLFQPYSNPRERESEHIQGLRGMALRMMASSLVGTTAGVEDLVLYVNHHMPSQEPNVEEDYQAEMLALARTFDWFIPRRWIVSPVNSPAALIHWRPLTFLLSRLSLADRELILKGMGGRLFLAEEVIKFLNRPNPRKRRAVKKQQEEKARLSESTRDGESSQSKRRAVRENRPQESSRGQRRAVRENRPQESSRSQRRAVRDKRPQESQRERPSLKRPEAHYERRQEDTSDSEPEVPYPVFKRRLTVAPFPDEKTKSPTNVRMTGTDELATTKPNSSPAKKSPLGAEPPACQRLTLDTEGSPELNYLDSPSPTKAASLTQEEEEALLESPRNQEEPMETGDPAAIGPKQSYAQAVGSRSSPIAKVPPRRKETVGDLAFDSHFHIDRLCRELHMTVQELAITHVMDPPPTLPVTLAGGCMIFCDPKEYDKIPKTWDKKWKIGIGVHPKKIQDLDEERMQQLQKLLKRHRVFGEIGLDFQQESDRQAQIETFERLLSLCEPHHVLVLHVRGPKADRYSDEALTVCLDLLKRHLPRLQKIHLHCFTGCRHHVKAWTSAFPLCHFGFTGLAKTFNRRQRDAVKSVPWNRLLLETDSPYLPVQKLRTNTPAYLGDVATVIADLRVAPVQVVLDTTLNNARQLY